jgi:hypothetical protein
MCDTLSIEKWDQAIFDARKVLRRVEEKAVRLRVAISSFEQSRRTGEPYPAQSTDHKSEAATQC